MAAPFVHTDFILGDTAESKAALKAIILFHTNAGHLALNDEAYNKDRGIETGNPFRKVITDLMEKGVQVELCGKTAASHGWVNADTIPGIQVNTDAMARLTQLVQEGYVKISEA